MHLTMDAPPLRATPRPLAALVHRMLEKEPAMRPGAIEVRQQARAIAHELASAYESYEVIRARSQSRRDAVVDPDSLELGITELVPTIRRPRWTPEIAISQLAPAVTPPTKSKPRHGR
jgi:hypothetical protein